MNHDEASRLLGAYLDGELDLTASVAIEDHIAGCESCQREMAAQQELIEAIRTETPRFEASPFLKTRIRAALREQSAPAAAPFWSKARLLWISSGAAMALLVALAFLQSSHPSIPQLVQDAVADHVRSLQVSHLMDVASTDQHTVKPWFIGKLDFSPPVADLADAGFPLVGGRLEHLDGRVAAALVYKRRQHVINLFIWQAGEGAVAPRQERRDGYSALTWSQGGLNFMAVSEIPGDELGQFVAGYRGRTE